MAGEVTVAPCADTSIGGACGCMRAWISRSMAGVIGSSVAQPLFLVVLVVLVCVHSYNYAGRRWRSLVD